MIKGQLFKFNREIGFGRFKIIIMNGIGNTADIGLLLGVGDHNHFFDGGQFFQNIGNPLQRIQLFAFKRIAIGRKQYFGFDLPESIQHAFDAEIRGTR